MDLLWHLLELNPASRTTAENALHHPFFNQIREIQDHSRFNYNLIPLKTNYDGNIPIEHFPEYTSLMHKNELLLKPDRNFMNT